MKIEDFAKLPWGTELEPTLQGISDGVFKPGQRFLFLGLTRDKSLVRVVMKGKATVYPYSPDFLEPQINEPKSAD